ncbi:hypothetical protein CC86DRAFT_365777 [Ophiobolus disseminans]|uniref:Uncharacterized protein n=1 Tax=Ophiobolus disseminans TaxID=1469910 RepID=A0A6A7AGJ6_9PLEO|nr:hypothetical protein CC86DRAFT_365777 [Ophiobolus disseminans]
MPHNQDEERAGEDERTPMLGRSSRQGKPDNDDAGDSKWSILNLLQFLGGGIYAPDPSTYDPIEILLNTEDEKERDDLTRKWKDNKLSELNFVGVVSALLAGVLTSTGSWPNILPNGQASPWSVRTSWYCGIILALFSILCAADQTVRLHRLSSHRDGLDNIRNLLAKNGKANVVSGRRKPSLIQIMTWQMPVMFLTTATLCMIVGMFLHVWSATTHLKKPSFWDDHTKVAVTYTVVAIFSIIVFFIGQVSLFSSVRR